MDILNIYICRMLRNTAMYSFAVVFVICLSLGCASQSDVKTDKQKISIEKIPVCYAYGCEVRQIVELDSSEWISVRSVFYPETSTAEEERKRIVRAIGYIEQLVGPKTGTNHDKPGGLAGLMSPSRGQMDCIDEATNTHTYLALLIQEKLILRHKLESNANRILPYGWPHTTAVLSDNNSGKRYAVDSWFMGNGMDAHIVPLTEWRLGWTPD